VSRLTLLSCLRLPLLLLLLLLLLALPLPWVLLLLLIMPWVFVSQVLPTRLLVRWILLLLLLLQGRGESRVSSDDDSRSGCNRRSEEASA